jgi:TonB family protein
VQAELLDLTFFRMAHHPISEPEPSTPEPSAGKLPVTFVEAGAEAALPLESDVAELAAKFAAHGAGKVSAETSAELALEVVLNEIVEQACLATGATGAAVLFERNGEMVCRATCGTNAPELGTRLDSESGLTSECVRTQQVQNCDDAQADPRVNVEASHQLGTRSVMVFPLLRSGNIAGVLEVFSSRPAAFGERDERTLEALAKRILKNVERTADSLSLAAVQNSPASHILPIPGTESVDSRAESETTPQEDKENVATPETYGPSPKGGRDAVVFGLGVAVVVCTVLFGTLVGWRLGAFRARTSRGQVAKSTSGADVRKPNSAAGGSATPSMGAISDAKAGTNTGPAPLASAAGNSTVGGKKNVTPRARTSAPNASADSFPPEGSLLVYENGKEVFRMPPTPGKGESAGSATGVDGSQVNGSEVRRASSVEPAGVLELSPEVAEGSLLYRVEPEYPEDARRQQMQGSVVLDVRMGRDGAVQAVNLVRGQSLLAEAAIAAVKQWRFKPRMVKGQPAEMQTKVTLNFRLPK